MTGRPEGLDSLFVAHRTRRITVVERTAEGGTEARGGEIHAVAPQPEAIGATIGSKTTEPCALTAKDQRGDDAGGPGDGGEQHAPVTHTHDGDGRRDKAERERRSGDLLGISRRTLVSRLGDYVPPRPRARKP